MQTKRIYRICRWVRVILPFCLFTFLPLNILAQEADFIISKGECIPALSDATADSHRASHRALIPKSDWDADRTYKQMVILFTFSDKDFTEEHPDPKAYYERLFNEEGYKERNGIGCIADYFREQSGGKLNLQFDIYGPIQVSTKAQPYESPDKDTRNYGRDAMREATLLVVDENPTVDYSQYDWDNDGAVDQVIYIYAGRPGNQKDTYGHIWPNTSSFTAVNTPDGKIISNYSASGEYWGKSKEQQVYYYCGIGTICHEYSHSLGLPDIYPVGTDLPYSAVDEWDLMDGGNFTNWGWCPPNMSPLEKMLMGWLTPVDLTEPTSITGMKTVSEGGHIYRIKHTDTEYLLLENRQWTGWDAGIPGKGLVIYHVNYDESIWRDNNVNSYSSEDKFRYKLVHADNKSFKDWETELDTRTKYIDNAERMNKVHLSTSPYPFEENNELTDTSTPAAGMSDETFLSKAITNIQMSDGLISFDFMGGATGIQDLRILDDDGESCLYNLQGQRVYIPLPGRVYIVKKKNGTTYKYMTR